VNPTLRTSIFPSVFLHGFLRRLMSEICSGSEGGWSGRRSCMGKVKTCSIRWGKLTLRTFVSPWGPRNLLLFKMKGWNWKAQFIWVWITNGTGPCIHRYGCCAFDVYRKHDQLWLLYVPFVQVQGFDKIVFIQHDCLFAFLLLQRQFEAIC